MTKPNAFGGISARQARRAQKENPAIKEVASAVTPELLARTGMSPGELLRKILSGDPEVKKMLQHSIAEQQDGLGLELDEEELSQVVKKKKRK